MSSMDTNSKEEDKENNERTPWYLRIINLIIDYFCS